jgi:PadR family transcriptional regulator, regulatory protein PadR
VGSNPTLSALPGTGDVLLHNWSTGLTKVRLALAVTLCKYFAMGASKAPKITANVALLLAAMLNDLQRGWYGLELADEAEIGSATVYAALTRLERAGWVRASWEDIDPKVAGRPRRRLYYLTGEGAQFGSEAVERHRTRLRDLLEPEGRMT